MALIIDGTARETLSVAGQEFSLIEPLAAGTLLWSGSQSSGSIQMPETVKPNWKNVNGIKIELLKHIPDRDRPDLIATSYVETDKLAFNPGAPFELSQAQLQSGQPITFNEVTKTNGYDFVFYANGARNGMFTKHGLITITPAQHEISLSVRDISLTEMAGTGGSGTYVITVARISAL